MSMAPANNHDTYFFSGVYIRHFDKFTLLSDLYLLKSSKASLQAVTANTNITGTIAISFPKACTCGTQFKATTNMKYKLAKR